MNWRQCEDRSASVIAAGLREIKTAGGARFHGLAHVMEKLAELPSPADLQYLSGTNKLAHHKRPMAQAKIYLQLKRICQKKICRLIRKRGEKASRTPLA
jgi:hypothetical protein